MYGVGGGNGFRVCVSVSRVSEVVGRVHDVKY